VPTAKPVVLAAAARGDAPRSFPAGISSSPGDYGVAGRFFASQASYSARGMKRSEALLMQ
jgi:hypothetical protein